MVDTELIMAKAYKFYLYKYPPTSDTLTSRVFHTGERVYVEVYYKDNTSQTVYIGNMQEFS